MCNVSDVSTVSIMLPNGNSVGPVYVLRNTSETDNGEYKCVFTDPNCGVIEEVFDIMVYGKYIYLAT